MSTLAKWSEWGRKYAVLKSGIESLAKGISPAVIAETVEQDVVICVAIRLVLESTVKVHLPNIW